jgi:3',5'-nucleoside bisphosphate phosphatase
MKKVILIGYIIFSLGFGLVKAQTRVEYKLPDIQGYYTLKGDFHIHTFYSDGSVAPEDRVKEAWRDGLDVIAITDHIEYPNSLMKAFDFNTSYNLALKIAQEYGILLIKGAEITRSMPPGHFNALFLTDVNKLNLPNVDDVYNEVVKQNGFLVWNHPGWSAQIKDTLTWYPKHTELYNQNKLNGIEIFNEKEYYPAVFQWALDKQITIFANSDIHAPIQFLYDPVKKEQRAMTVVFVKDKTIQGVKDAFLNHRTIAIFDQKMYGEEQYLKPLIENCIVVSENITMPQKFNEAYVSLTNYSDLPIYLKAIPSENFELPDHIELLPNGTVRVKIAQIKDLQYGINKINLLFKVENGFIAPNKNATIALPVTLMNWGVVKIVKTNSVNWMIDTSLASRIDYLYSLDGNTPYLTSEKPFPFSDSIHLKMDAQILTNPFESDYIPAPFLELKKSGSTYEADYFLHNAMNQKIVLTNQPNAKYEGNGVETLIDGLKGSNSYTDGKWLGFKGDDMEAIITFDSLTDISKMELCFLESNHSWIFMPTKVSVEVSTDGIHFKPLNTTFLTINQSENNTGIQSIKIIKKAQKVKTVKINAKNRKVCPNWHSGSGKPCWLFISEIIIR